MFESNRARSAYNLPSAFRHLIGNLALVSRLSSQNRSRNYGGQQDSEEKSRHKFDRFRGPSRTGKSFYEEAKQPSPFELGCCKFFIGLAPKVFGVSDQ
jgi:hypothetical protein